jgi:hypothetical protein
MRDRTHEAFTDVHTFQYISPYKNHQGMFWKRKKEKATPYRCAQCGEIHANWPALAHPHPFAYAVLTEDAQQTMAELSPDFCVIRHPDQTDRFIRAVLTIPVVDAKENLDYGAWVSLSEASFTDYEAHYHDQEYEKSYFGWLNNTLAGYEDTLSIPMTVVNQPGNARPSLFPHEDYAHPLVKDFYQGISAHEAQRRVDEILSGHSRE